MQMFEIIEIQTEMNVKQILSVLMSEYFWQEEINFHRKSIRERMMVISRLLSIIRYRIKIEKRIHFNSAIFKK